MSARFRAAAAALGALALTAPASPASAGLLDEPPKVVRMQLDDRAAPSLTLLQPFFEADVERLGPVRRYLGSSWGTWSRDPWWRLAWAGSFSAEAQPSIERRGAMVLATGGEGALRIEPETPPTWLGRLNPEWSPSILTSTGPSFASNGFDALWEPPPKPVPWWKRCRRRAVTFVRYGAEQDTFPLVRCDGSVASFAIDRLSIVARPPEVPRPGDLLPDEPDAAAWLRGEWIPSVHLIHPRLLWALQRIADEFPRRVVYVFSGYRPPNGPLKRGTHHSMHAEGRAMDVSVMGISNADLFKLCHTLDDVGCGFYPNSKFVHVDVRRPGTGHAFWIDVSAPSEPSRYVDTWPGVIESGALAWDRRAEIDPGAGSLRSATPSPR